MKRLLTAATLTVLATPAFAHHPLAGVEMTTFVHGMLSGVGHPLLGFDHLFFVVLVGIAALFTGRAMIAPLFYVAGMLGGTALALMGLGLPIAETAIVASLIITGFAVASGRALVLPMAGLIFAGFGLFHGTAFAGSILGQEAGATAAVITGYLLGLGVAQYIVAIAAGFALKAFSDATEAGKTAPRLAGAVVAGAGLFLALEQVEGVAFAALGWG